MGEEKGKLGAANANLPLPPHPSTSPLPHMPQAALVNALLRNYLHHNLNDQADKLISKVKFPDSAGNHQVARYMYYLGSIKAIQLDYTASHGFLSQAIRKVPQTPANIGFLQTVNKLAIIVQLLMGEIPERSLFRQPILKKTLAPYFHLTQGKRVAPGPLPLCSCHPMAHSNVPSPARLPSPPLYLSPPPPPLPPGSGAHRGPGQVHRDPGPVWRGLSPGQDVHSYPAVRGGGACCFDYLGPIAALGRHLSFL
jgi:hypothetical protein